MENYQLFASMYDLIMERELYQQWLTYTEAYLPSDKSARLLDLGCGTGEIALTFLEKGYDVTGLDLSEEMLEIAYTKASNRGLYLPLIQGNMLDLDIKGEFDIIYSFSDTICYLDQFEQWQTTFANVYEALADNGVFLFDVHSLYQINDLFPGFTFNRAFEDAAFLWHSLQDKKDTITHNLTFFIQNEGQERYDRFEEVHVETTFAIERIVSGLKGVGFKSIEVSSDYGQNAVDETTTRWFFACRK